MLERLVVGGSAQRSSIMSKFNNGRPVLRPDACGAGQNTAANLLVDIEPLLVTRDDAARLLSVSIRKLDLWVDRGLIPKWKLDRVVRFAVDDLRAFVQKHKVKTPSAAIDGDKEAPNPTTLPIPRPERREAVRHG